jgi:hypothetical protein
VGIAHGGDMNQNGCALAATWSDYDNDGDLDLMVINDFGPVNVPNRLFRNDGPGGPGGWIFTDVSAESGFDFAMYGMGIAVGDIDLDGDFDYYMTDIGPNNLALNNGDGTFTDIAASAGVEASDPDIYGGQGLVSWGTEFFDADHDGYVDLFVANGGAPPEKWPDMFGADYVDQNPNYTYKNLHNNTFSERHTQIGITVEQYNRGAAFSDYDNDGDVDIYIGNLQGFNTLYRNDGGNVKNWLKVKAIGTIGNRDAIGARIKASVWGITQMREINGGSSFLSRNSLVAHFGVNNVTLLDKVVVAFPSGLSYELRDVGVNQTIQVVEPIYTVGVATEALTVVRGNSFTLEDVITNQTDQAQTVGKWVDVVKPDGTQMTMKGPNTRTFGPNQTVNGTTTFRTGSDMQLGAYTLIYRVGTYPSQVTHQDFVNVEVIP